MCLLASIKSLINQKWGVSNWLVLSWWLFCPLPQIASRLEGCHENKGISRKQIHRGRTGERLQDEGERTKNHITHTTLLTPGKQLLQAFGKSDAHLGFPLLHKNLSKNPRSLPFLIEEAFLSRRKPNVK